MTYMDILKNIPKDFLSDVKAQCLEWSHEVANSDSKYHDIMTLRPRDFHFIDRKDWTEWHLIRERYGADKAREWKRRQIRMVREFGIKSKITIDQYDLPDDMTQHIKEETHKLVGIPMDEIIPVVQIQDGGEILYPHRGHARQASFFCLLQGEGEITKWYRETEPFIHYEEYYIPDMKKLDVVVSTTLKENEWIVFNHREWHSVHRESDTGVRINFGLDFKTLTVDQVLEYLK
jgi:hypothetical protein